MKFQPNYSYTARLTQRLLQIERCKEAIAVLPISATLIAALRETARLQTTHYSTQIEGNALTQEEVKQVVEGIKGGFPGRERDEYEVRNYFEALEYLEAQLKNEKSISETLIKTIHGLVYKGSQRPTPYRDGQNVIRDGQTGAIVYMPPEAKDVAEMMKSLTYWINKEIKNQEIPAPIIAGLAHYQFATIHPYYDGNGRTARLLTTYILHQTGYGMKGIYSLEEYYAKNLQDYYRALTIGKSHNYYMGRAEADVTPFLDYFLEGMSISFQKVRDKAERFKSLQKNKVFYHTEKIRELRAQQRQVLSLFSKVREVSANEVAEHLGINSRSAYGLLKKWLDQGFVTIENPSKKARTYILSKEWEQYIEKQFNQSQDLEL